MTYTIIYAFGSMLAFVKNFNKISFFLFLTIIIFLQAFRYGVGPDYSSYETIYNFLSSSFSELDSGASEEIVFQIIGFFSKTVNLSYQQYVAIIGAVSLYFVAKTCWKYSNNPVFSLVLYYSFFYFVWIFSGLRQGLALSIGVYYLLTCLENKQHVKFVLINIVLVLIHTSSIFLLFFYIVGNLRISKSAMIILLAMSFFMQFMPGNVFQRLIEVVPFGNRVAFYNDIIGINPFDFKSLARVFLLVTFGFILPNQVFKNSDMNYRILIIYISSFSLYFILRQSEILASNTSIYGFVMIIILLPNILNSFQIESNKNIYIIGSLLFASFFLFKNLSSMQAYSGLQGNYMVTPYTHIYNKDTFVFVDMHAYHDGY